MKTAVITGAGGFIGRALTQYLASQGVQVYAQIRPGQEELLAQIAEELPVNVVVVSLEEGEAFSSLLSEIHPDVLYHMAWHGMSSDLKSDWEIQLSNIPMTMKVLEACTDGRCGRVVIPGSTSEYAYCGGRVTGGQGIPMLR